MDQPSYREFSVSFQIVILSFLTTFLFVGFSNVKAQDESDSLQVKLDPIQVTAVHATISAADAPLSLSTYSRDLQSMAHNSSLSLSSIGNELPGLWVNDRQNYALGERLTIRGIGWRAQYGVRGIQVVLNGIPLTVADGQTMFNIVDPAFIRQAELVRGPAASYWGNSSGGVLYLSTEPSYNENSSFRLRTMAGSFGMRKVGAEFSISNPNHNMSAYSSYLTTDGYRNYSAAKVNQSGITGSVNLTSRSQLKYQAASVYMPFAEHPSSLSKQDAKTNPQKAIPGFISAGAGKSLTQGQAGLSYLLETPAGMLNITSYGIYRDLNNPLPFGIITVNRWLGGLRTTLDKSWDNFELQVGVESKLQNDDRTEFESIGNSGEAQRGDITVDRIERVWNQAIFATGTYSTGPFNILGSLRFDRLIFHNNASVGGKSGHRTFQSLSPSIGINYQPGNQTIFANLSSSFRAPTTTELGNRPQGNGFNPTLEPEQTLGLETGIRGSNTQQSISYDLTAYRLWTSGLLLPYQLRPNGPTYYRNQGKSQHTGLEGKLSWQMNRNWSARVTTNISRAKFKDGQTDSTSLKGKSVPGIPNMRFNSQLSWSPGSFLGSVTYEYISSYYANSLNTFKNNQYSVFDAKISYQVSFQNNTVYLRPFLNVSNLFNVRYNSSLTVNAFGNEYYEPAPGRNWQLGISVDF